MSVFATAAEAIAELVRQRSEWLRDSPDFPQRGLEWAILRRRRGEYEVVSRLLVVREAHMAHVEPEDLAGYLAACMPPMDE